MNLRERTEKLLARSLDTAERRWKSGQYQYFESGEQGDAGRDSYRALAALRTALQELTFGSIVDLAAAIEAFADHYAEISDGDAMNAGIGSIRAFRNELIGELRPDGTSA